MSARSDEEDLMPCIEVLDGRCRGELFVLDQLRAYVVGRMPGVEILINDHGVSRRHVKLTRHGDGRIEAVDLRSTNGLILNDERVDRALLLEGDQIRLGPDAVLCLRWLEPAELEARATSRLTEAHADTADQDSGQHDSEDARAIVIVRPRLEDLPLSPRQLEVSRLVATGLTNAAIAEQLGVSPRTVTSHLDHIYARLGIGSRAALTRWIVERGLG